MSQNKNHVLKKKKNNYHTQALENQKKKKRIEKRRREEATLPKKKRKKRQRYLLPREEEKRKIKARAHRHFCQSRKNSSSLNFLFILGRKHFGGPMKKTLGPYHLFFFLPIQPNTL